MEQIFYITHVKIGIGLPEPDPVTDKDLVIRQCYPYIQGEAEEACQNYSHYSYRGNFSPLSWNLFAHLRCTQNKYLADLNMFPIINLVR